MVEIASTPQRETAKAVLVQGAWYPKYVLVTKYVGCGITKTYVPASWYAKKAGDRAKYYMLQQLNDMATHAKKADDMSMNDEFSSYSHVKFITMSIQALWEDIHCYLENRDSAI